MNSIIQTLHTIEQETGITVARMLPPNSPKAKSIQLALIKRALFRQNIPYTCIYDAPLLMGDGRAVYRAFLKVAGLTMIRACWIQ